MSESENLFEREYNKLLKPFESAKSAQHASNAFFDDIKALRIKHRLPDVTVIVNVRCMTNGREAAFESYQHYGNAYMASPMAMNGSIQFAKRDQEYNDENGTKNGENHDG